MIELMIVVAIIGIIAAIALPSYQGHIERTRRSLAQADMLELVQSLERRYATGFDYRAADGSNPPLPFTTSPREAGDGAAYRITFPAAVARDMFTLRATPTALQDGDRCGALEIDHRGVRSAAQNDCW